MALSKRAKLALLSGIGLPSKVKEISDLIDEVENVETADIVDGAVTADKLASSSVTAAKIDALAVTTAKIDALAVTSAKLASDSVITAKILNSNVTTAKLADSAITSAKMDENLLKYSDITILSADILQLNATPYQLLAAPGANKVILVDSVYFYNDYNSAAYSASTDTLDIKYTDGSGALIASATNAFIEASSDAFYHAQPSSVVPVPNAAIVAHVGNADPITGDGNIKIRVYYRTVSSILA